MTAKKEIDEATGKASLGKVKSTLQALPTSALLQSNVDMQSAAMAALVVVDRARQGDRRAQFAKLPAELFAKSTIDDLEVTANAALHVEVEAAREGSASSGVKVDAAVVQEATELRARMLKTADYNLGHLQAVSRELADIRLGAGYLDLANDLSRLATLYATHKSELAADRRHYETRDADRGASFARKIRDEYRAAASRSGEYTELRPRAFSELSRLYNEVRAAAEFLFRNEPAVLDEFPPLRAAAAALSPTRRSKKQADPVPSPTNGDGASPAGSTN